MRATSGVARLGRFTALLILSSTAYAAVPNVPTSTAVATGPQSTACGAIVNDPNQSQIFKASLVYECLSSIPFNAAVATRFVQYINDTLRFQTTLTYLKNPPASYQQPAVDLLQGIENIQQGIDDGAFPNQYEFEAALQTLLYAAHDSHLNMVAGVLAPFSFGSPYDIISLSIDGIQLPKVYLANDLFDSAYFSAPWQPSAIQSINGEDVTDYLTAFASKNSIGTLEPHADWNQMMLSPSKDIQAQFDVFSGGATFYPGDNLTFVMENGSVISTEYLAVYYSPGDTGPLETGGDFYNFFVLGLYPASYDPDADSSDNSTASAPTTTASTASSTISSMPTASSWNNSAYPAIPDVFQPDLGTYGGGSVSAYYIDHASLAVLSVPDFHSSGENILNFQATITLFLATTTARGIRRVLIDLQGNSGGQTFLAIDLFKQFFPQIDPFAGSRMRAHYAANVMGNAMTTYWDTLPQDDDNYAPLAANEWVSSDRLNAATGQNFTSWNEFFGPHAYNGDNFTTTQRYNLSNFIFDAEATGGDVPFAVYGTDAYPANTTQPYDPSNIVILTDGYCASSCALLVEMMRQEGVRIVVAGGRPIYGPMQAASGSRGARSYTFGGPGFADNALDNNIDFAQQLLVNTTDEHFLPNRTEALDVWIHRAELNLRDQVRKGEDVPLQFVYDAADCRIFFTPQTVYNYTALWLYAGDAIWTSPGLCVRDSTGHFVANVTNLSGPPSTYAPPNSGNHTNSELTASLPHLVYANDGLTDSTIDVNSRKIAGIPCDSKACPNGFFCADVQACSKTGKPIAAKQCQPVCFPSSNTCSPCQPVEALKVRVGSQLLSRGFCVPSIECGGGGTVRNLVVGPAPPP